MEGGENQREKKGTGKMETSAYIALSRQGALRREMDVIANNLANMNTTAYKGEKMMFVEHLVKSRGGDSFVPAKLSFVRDIAQVRNFSEGPIQSTSNPLDLAIKNEGYFVIETPEGERYTRNGRFQLNQEGKLVTQHGHPVLSDAGAPFFFGPEDKEIQVARDGTLSTNNGELGKIRVVSFESEQKLQKTAGGLLTTEQPPTEVEKTNVVQGALEGSNVQPIIELTKMIATHRAYDSVRNFVNKEGERQGKMIQVLGQR
jgi:flagellar basal-body rod protein FlgF